MSDETGEAPDPQISFKIKTGDNGLFSITIAETATVLDLKKKIETPEYTKQPAAYQRLIYSGKIMKDGDQLKTYNIKDGNTLHMVKM
jgi:ubiquilin